MCSKIRRNVIMNIHNEYVLFWREVGCYKCVSHYLNICKCFASFVQAKYSKIISRLINKVNNFTQVTVVFCSLSLFALKLANFIPFYEHMIIFISKKKCRFSPLLV